MDEGEIVPTFAAAESWSRYQSSSFDVTMIPIGCALFVNLFSMIPPVCGLINPIAPEGPTWSVNQMSPLRSAARPSGMLACRPPFLKTSYSMLPVVAAVFGLIVPMSPPPGFWSANQRFPSGPAVIPLGRCPLPSPLLNSVIVPVGVTLSDRRRRRGVVVGEPQVPVPAYRDPLGVTPGVEVAAELLPLLGRWVVHPDPRGRRDPVGEPDGAARPHHGRPGATAWFRSIRRPTWDRCHLAPRAGP